MTAQDLYAMLDRIPYQARLTMGVSIAVHGCEKVAEPNKELVGRGHTRADGTSEFTLY